MKRTYLIALAPVAAILLYLVLAAPQQEAGEPAWEAGRPSAESTRVPSAVPAAPEARRDRGARAAEEVRSATARRSGLGAPDSGETLSEVLGDEEDPDFPDRLDRMMERIMDGLYDGSVQGLDVLARIRDEQSPEVVDALFEALAEAADVALAPEVLAAWLEMARSEGDSEKRWSAVRSLGRLTDEDGAVRRVLLDLARHEGDEEVRYAAIGSLAEHAGANPEAAGEVSSAALEIARTSEDEGFRAEALSAVDLYRVERTVVADVAGFLADPSGEVRLVAAEVLGRAKAEDREEILRTLERAYSTEKDLDVRSVMLDSIVQAGRHRALEVLRGLKESDPDLAATLTDYAAVLETGEVDIDRIQEQVEDRLLERFEREAVAHDDEHGHEEFHEAE